MNYFKNIFLALFFLVNFADANDVEYSFHISNENPYEREAIFLEVNLTQMDTSKVMLFKFSLQESNDYEFHQVGFKEHEKYHDLRHEYIYLIYPKRSGRIVLEFNMIKSITDDDKVAYSISGDRDNVKGLQKEDVVVTLNSLPIEVKAIPLGVQLVGDFSLTHTLDKKETEAYNPVNINVQLRGKGFLSSFNLLKENDAYRLFTQIPKAKILHTKNASITSLEWDYAISSKKNFTLPKVNLKVFNPKNKKTYDLGFPAYAVKVNKVDEASLLDKVDYPPKSRGIDWNFWTWFFSYIVVFVAGFLMPRGLFKHKIVLGKSSEDILKHKIKEAKTHKILLQVLLLENSHNFKDAIRDLESVVYNAENKSLTKIKNSINEGNKCHKEQ